MEKASDHLGGKYRNTSIEGVGCERREAGVREHKRKGEMARQTEEMEEETRSSENGQQSFCLDSGAGELVDRCQKISPT